MAKARLPVNLPLQGKRVRLDALNEEDLAELRSFFRNPASLYYYVPSPVFPRTLTQLRKNMADWHDNRSYFTFAIRAGEQLAGLLHLDSVDYINGNAEIGIAITNTESRGQGFAAEAISLMLDYAFGELRLERITARIIDGNEPSLKLFRGLGFTQEGQLRHYVRRNNNWHDLHVFGLLSSEWANRQLGK